MNDLSEIKVSQVMTREVIAASPKNKVSQVLRFFVEKNINHIPVVDNDKLVGIISAKDMLRLVYKRVYIDKHSDLDETTISEVMTPNPFSIDEDMAVMDLKELFGKAPFNCLPVTREGKLIGIVTPKDIMKMRIIKVEGSDYGGY